MERVTGLGGAFFKCKDPGKIITLYRGHLGIESDQHGGMFEWRDPNAPEKKCYTAWSPFSMNSIYFAPSEKPFMFNYRVENPRTLLDVLRSEGVTIVGEIEEYDYGKFGWILDPEGDKIELWEPVDEISKKDDKQWEILVHNPSHM